MFDVLIIGGGISGSATAILLQKAGYKTIIVEKTDLIKFKPGESITPKCKIYFNSIGINFDDSNSGEYYGINSQWGSNDQFNIDFAFNPYGNGVTLERQLFEKKLINEAISLGCTVNLYCDINELNFNKNEWNIKMKNNSGISFLKSKYIIVATGRSSFQKINKCKTFYYDKLIAFSILSKGSHSRDNLQYLTIQALSSGWFYSNNLPHEKNIMSFFTDFDLIPNTKSKVDYLKEQFVLTDVVENSKITSLFENEIITIDARTTWKECQSGVGWLRLGDAAYSIDPLSGKGIEKNLEMIFYIIEHFELFLNNTIEIHNSYKQNNYTNFTQFNNQRKNTYSNERRWPENPFWERRIRA